VRTFGTGILLLLLVGACREIHEFAPVDAIDGYELQGVVTSQNGMPLDSVAVRLDYDFSFVSSRSLDTIQVVVTDSTKIVFVAVFEPSGRYVRELFFGFRSAGVVPHFKWDERDDNGEIVPSGPYVVRYVVDTVIVKEVGAIADGNISAYTNENGAFTLTGDRFPVGVQFNLYTDAGEFAGVYRVLEDVQLRFSKGSFTSSYIVTMNHNSITRSTFTLR
jgi:hypothetical protein